jgi:hypothetical protein
LQQLTVTLFPPHNMEDAEALATGGNMAVPFLTHRNEFKEQEAAASVRALRLIGTSQARKALRSFLKDRRESVISELAQAVNPFEIEWVRELLLAEARLPEGIASQMRDLTPLAGLDNLKSLGLNWTQVADLSPLEELNGLQNLGLSWTQVVDLSPLAKLKNLQVLGLRGTQVTDLTPLAGLNSIQSLDLSETQVTNLSPLAKLKNLKSLFLMQTKVEDLSPLKELENLQTLSLYGTQVVDLSSLVEIKNLKILGLREEISWGRFLEQTSSFPKT